VRVRPPAIDAIELSADEARRVALDSQGLHNARPARAPTVRDVRRTIDRIRVLQIDSINVLVRAHYLPLFSRLGPYDRAILDRLAYERRELYEAWAHAATILPTRFHRLLRWRAERKPWPELARIERERPGHAASVLRRIEVYTPESKRVYGYYVLPFLLDGDVCARVDLKADRASSRLLVRAARLEPGRDAARVVGPLAHELSEMARWLELDRVVVERRGDLSARLRDAVRAPAAAR
jgi:uncharacterized protein YcaQ